MYKFIDWNILEIKGKSSGKVKTTCPICSSTRKNKSDKCLYINISNGFAKCYHCEALSFRKDEESVEYKIPNQEWKNFTKLSDNVVKYFESRKINQITLSELGVTEEKYYQPSLKKEVLNIVFNYFEGNRLVNKKYRSAGKKFTQTSGTKSIFYNINSIIGNKECWIVEGEMDVLSLHQIGIKNVVSVPNGANDNDDYWENSEIYLKDVKRFVIAVDNDSKGNILKEKIAQRLGRYRCDYVVWDNKDANGDLVAGIINDTSKNRKSFPVSGTFKISDLSDGIKELYDNGLPETIYPKHNSFGDLKNVFTVMRGHLVTCTGIPSHGKSNYVEWYVLNLINDYDMKASFFSPEHLPMKLHQTNFIQKAIGKPFWRDLGGCRRLDKNDIDRYEKHFNEKLYLTSVEDGEFPTWDWIFKKMKEQVYSYGIDIFVIDAFNKLELPKGNNLEQINRVLTKLTMFAQINNVIIFLVVHPTKMKKNESGIYDMPTLYDCSGSADFRNQTHDGFGIYRYFDDKDSGIDGYVTFTNLKTKYTFQGNIGKSIEYDYHIPTGRYFVRGTQPPLFDMTNKIEELPKLDTCEAFEDIPF